jgi:purine-nucleoside phosphorylase
MTTMMSAIKETYAFLKNNGYHRPDLGVVLGTGLGKLVDEINISRIIPYDEIPNFPQATVEFHSGNLIFGKLEGKNVIAMQGRFHYYEGYSFHQICLPVRVMKLLGVNKLLISNAAGSMNPAFKKGSLMLIEDHINLLPGNPLIGPNLDEFGPRFPDMSEPYDKVMNRILLEAAARHHVELHRGVYVVVPGPMLETRAEYRYLRNIGADVVGMSTVPEVIVAHHMDLPVSAISVLTDECDPDNLAPVDITDILETAASAETGLIQITRELLKGI